MPSFPKFPNLKVSNTLKFIWLFVAVFFFLFNNLHAEGTKEIRPSEGDYGYLILDQGWSNFAFYDAPEENRLQISICNPNEIIYFGFNQNDKDVEFRLKDENGTVVFGPMLVPSTGAGFINLFNQAIAGPQQIVGTTGYNALSYTAVIPGDYYIEFKRPAGRREFEMFDITVASASKKAIPGRVWSKAWMFSTRAFGTQFQGKLFIYADDGIVTSLDFNGMQPYVFVLSANRSGTGNTGNTALDRKSKNGNVTYPQYKIFLNDPDTKCYPTGVFGKLTKPTTITGCGLDKCINIFVDKPGNIEVLLDLNGVSGYQRGTTDTIISNFVEVGANCVQWNSRDGKGNIVKPGVSIPMEVNYFNGLTHLPLYDVEAQSQGFVVELVRPAGPKPQLFWDDTLIKPANSQKVNLAGCLSASGCHRWNWAGSDNVATDYGNTNTLNTWWYANVIKTNATFLPGNVFVDANTSKPEKLGNDTTVCATVGSIQLYGAVIGATGGSWTGGAGNFSLGRTSMNSVYTPTPAEKTSGKVKLILTSNAGTECPPVSDSLNILFTPAPVANAGPDQNICSNLNSISLDGSVITATGGVWTGGKGKFAPDSTSLKGIYSPIASEKTGVLLLTLTTTENGLCSPGTDELKITFTDAPTVNAGKDTAVCTINPVIHLVGKLSVATTGKWTGGLGNYDSGANSLDTKYNPTPAEIAGGSLVLTLTSLDNGMCNSSSDQIKITFSGKTIADVGTDKTVCSNAKINLNGVVTGASGGEWTGGKGLFNPNAQTLNAVYTPDQTEIDKGSFQLFLTSTTDGCSVVKDTLNITFTSPPKIDAGSDTSVCSNNINVQLKGKITGASGILWSSDGEGTFIPNPTTLNAVYTPSQVEINAKIASLQIISTGNAGCLPVKDIMLIAINPAPTVDAGPDQIVCENNPSVVLNAKTTNNPSSKIWSGGTAIFLPDASNDKASYTATSQEVSNKELTLTYTVNKSGCNAVSDNVKISYTPTPVADAGSQQTICFNNPTVNLNGTYSTATSAKWIGGKGNFNPDENSLTAVYTPDASELAAGSFQLYLLTSGNLNCKPVKDSVLISISGSPELTAGPDQTVCSNNAAIKLNGSVTKVATGGIWSGGNGIFSVNADDLTGTYTPTSSEISAGSLVLTLTSTNNGNCNAVNDQVKIDFSPIPVANAGNDITVCADNPIATLDGSFTIGANGAWSGGNGTFDPGANNLKTKYTPSMDEISAGQVTLVLSSIPNTTYGSCKSVSDNVNIKMLNAPSVSPGSDQTACGNITSLRLNGAVNNALGGNWSTDGSGTFSDANSLNATYSPSALDKTKGLVNLKLTSTGNGLCSAVSNTLKITFTSTPTISAGPNQNVCSNDLPFVLKGSGSPASWLNGSGTFTSSRNQLNASYMPSNSEIANGFIVLKLSTNGSVTCPSVADSVKISFIDGPKTNAGANNTICGNLLSYQLKGTINSNFKIIWTTGGTGSFSPNFNDLNPVYTFSTIDKKIGFVDFTLISIYNKLCNADSSKVRITLLPEPKVIAGPLENICADTKELQLKGSIANATSAVWSSNGTGNFLPTNSDLNARYQISTADVLNGNIDLTLTTVSDGICGAVLGTKKIIIAPAPKVKAGNNTTICADSDYVALAGNVTIAKGGKWSTSGTGTFSPNEYDLNAKYYLSTNDKSLNKITLKLTSEGNGNCNSVSDSIILNITPIPLVTAGASQIICADATSIILNGNVTNATSLRWASNGSGSFDNADVKNPTYTLSASDKQKSFLLFTANSTGNATCKSVNNKVTMTITPPPIAKAGIDQSICADASGVNLNGIVSIVSKGKWSTTGSGTFSPNDSLLNAIYKPSIADNNAQKVTVILTSGTIGNCVSRKDSMDIFIKPTPVVSAGLDQIVCADTSGIILAGSILNAKGNIWSTTGTGKFFPNSAVLNPKYVLSAQDIKNGSVTFVITSDENGTCMPVKDDSKATITSPPTITLSSDTVVCSDISQIPVKAKVTIASGGYWSTSGGGKFLPDSSFKIGTYVPSVGDKATGNLLLTYITTGNGNCKSVKNHYKISIIPSAVVNVGVDKSICANVNTIDLQGIVKNAEGGIWSSSGTGFFLPENSILKTQYLISSSDKSNGKIKMILTSTGNGMCNAITDTINLSIISEPTANAGVDQVICNTTSSVKLNGSVNNSTGGTWVTSGTGYFSPTETNLNATYVLSDADKLKTNFRLTLYTTGNDVCTQASDQLMVQINPAPSLDAGPDISSCEDREFVQIKAVMNNSSSGKWSSSGNGFFSPDKNNVETNYIPSKSDKLNKQIILTFISTGNISCSPASDQLNLTFMPAPTLEAGPDQTVCPDVTSIEINPIITVANSAKWSTSGTGTFNIGPESKNINYVPSPDDITAGIVDFRIATTENGSCNALYDSVRISFTGVPQVEAGLNKTICTNKFPISLQGSGTTGNWSGYTGLIDPSNSLLNAKYTPSSAEISAGFVKLYLTSTSTGTCSPSKDSVTYFLPSGPLATAGNDTSICANISRINLNGNVSNATGGIWSTSGTGKFFSENDLNAAYEPSEDDKIGGVVTLTLTTLFDATCDESKDNLILNIIPNPSVFAGLDRTICADATGINLMGTGKNANTVTWTSFPSGGTFTPPNTLSTKFEPSSSNISSGTVNVILSSTGISACPNVSDTLLININPLVTVNAGVDKTFCADIQEIQLQAVKTVAGGVVWGTSGKGYFLPNDQTLNAKYVPQGTDTSQASIMLFVNTKDNGTCKPASDNLLVNFKPSPQISAGPDQTICSDMMSVQLNGVVKVATGLKWKASGKGTFTLNDTLPNVIYNFTQEDKDAGGIQMSIVSTGNDLCNPVTDYMSINLMPIPAAKVNAGFDQTLCANTKSVQLNGIVSGAGGGIWKSTGNGKFLPDTKALDAQYIPTNQDTAAGTIQIILTTTDNGICNAVTDTLDITFRPVPLANAGKPHTICADSSYIQLNGLVKNAGGGIWKSSGSGNFSPSTDNLTPRYIPSAADVAAGKIGLTLITTGNGICEEQSNAVIITITPKPTIDAGPDATVCANNPSITLKGTKTLAKGGVKWSTSGSGIFSDDFALSPDYEPSDEDKLDGTVMIQIRSTLNGNCKPVTDLLQLSIIPAPLVEAGPDQVVCGDLLPVKLSGKIKTATFATWSTLGSGKFIPNSNSLQTDYSPSISDIDNKNIDLILTTKGENNCLPVSDTIKITMIPKPEISIENAVVCEFTVGAQLKGNVLNAGGGKWLSSETGTFTPDIFDLNAKYIPSQSDILKKSAILTLVSTSNGICKENSKQSILSILPAPIADAGKDKIICRGTNTNLIGRIEKSINYHWESTTGQVISSNENVNIVAFTDTSFTFVATDNRGCPSKDIIKIGVIDPPKFDMDNQFCLNDTLMVDSKPQNLPLVNGMFQWYQNNSNLLNENKSIIFPDQSGKYKIVYSYSSCYALDTTTINDSPILQSFNKFACESELTELKTTSLSNVKYSWSFNSKIIGSTNPIQVSIPVDTNYYIVNALDTITGCSGQTITRVIGLPKPIINLTDQTACENDTLYLLARPSNISGLKNLFTSYDWKKDNKAIDFKGDSLAVKSGGKYSVIVKVEVCSTADSATLKFNPTPLPLTVHEAEFCSESDPFVVLNGSIQADVKNFWITSGKSFIKDSVKAEGTYLVKLTNKFNCSIIDSMVVKDLCPPRFFIPNAMKPGEKIEHFQVFGKDFTNFKIMVFSRWGEIIYSSEDKDQTWDGMYRGEPMPIGVYPYIVTYQGVAKGYKKTYKKEGSITIIR